MSSSGSLFARLLLSVFNPQNNFPKALTRHQSINPYMPTLKEMIQYSYHSSLLLLDLVCEFC